MTTISSPETFFRRPDIENDLGQARRQSLPPAVTLKMIRRNIEQAFWEAKKISKQYHPPSAD